MCWRGGPWCTVFPSAASSSCQPVPAGYRNCATTVGAALDCRRCCSNADCPSATSYTCITSAGGELGAECVFTATSCTLYASCLAGTTTTGQVCKSGSGCTVSPSGCVLPRAVPNCNACGVPPAQAGLAGRLTLSRRRTSFRPLQGCGNLACPTGYTCSATTGNGGTCSLTAAFRAAGG